MTWFLLWGPYIVFCNIDCECETQEEACVDVCLEVRK